ncbi:MAG: zinc ribbon domain-containing protein [Candidatus Omnitrophica bacterium]|nr:zinc ribbon domain-containing protein [Candidatus Omnitrophota bacterium]MDD5236854.1 zinc ribbon domain-containing protein [Candidatus Omnitrophota bacterium]MDD5610788.1 zinc ribbon domain-containing protein [Candidatus Omnitrophota bacterium]
MPTYEYECLKCGHHFDLLQSMAAKPIDKCPKCTGKVKRLIGSGSGLIFKGTGFYATDYKKNKGGHSHGSGSSGCAGCPHTKKD